MALILFWYSNYNQSFLMLILLCYNVHKVDWKCVFAHSVPTHPHVQVQTQIGLWSDPVERTSVCSQTEITGSGRKFERTTVWSMVWRWSDQSSFWSEESGPWSGDGLIRGQLGLKSLIIGRFERTRVWSEATSSAIWCDHNLFERTLVWSEAASSAIWCDHNLFEHTLVWSEATSSAIESDHKCFRTQLGLIRDHFERPNFFIFLLRAVGSAKRQQ